MERQACIMIFTEQKKGAIHPVVFELIGKARELCASAAHRIELAVLGSQDMDLDPLFGFGVHRIHHIMGEQFDLPDERAYTAELFRLIEEASPSVLLLGATAFGRSLAPRLAAALKTGLTADCTQLKMAEDGSLLQIRPAFSGNILAHIKCESLPQMATVRYKEFPPAEKEQSPASEILKYASKDYESTLSYREIRKNDLDITEYEVIVSGGKGIKQASDFEMLRELASLMGGQIGASRAVVEEGYLPKDYQVGYSGHRVKPKLYIACGISGAPQHIAGMKDADVVLAINSDPSAPIFNIADYGIVGDLYQVVPMLIENYRKIKER
ncbi:MAG: electron transfer flavoprotein subunit alpha/FixB family protein [Peptostreptococcaceae bacterium]|nr:electron transfer flavoprotein subunit alpha/FixB family protein [Peptostreptococcaceae bacterium]